MRAAGCFASVAESDTWAVGPSGAMSKRMGNEGPAQSFTVVSVGV
jgi:hypothetical protein